MAEQLPNMQDNNQQILNDIQSLQSIEQELFNSLDNTNLSAEEQGKIISKINRISEMRITLYKTLSGVNNFFQNALTNSRGTLTEQTEAISIIEDELNQAKKRLQILDEDKNNKIRLVEINNYYSQKYEEQTNLMKIVIAVLIPIILLSVLNKTGILPMNIYVILVTIVVMIGGYFFFRRFVSILMRDNTNYAEYDWYFDKNSAPKATTSDGSDPWLGAGIGSCIGPMCCSEGQTYDSQINQCVGSSNITDPATIDSALTKGVTTNLKPDVTLNSAVEPFTSNGLGMYKGFRI
jgi:hypothetical protein